MDELTDNFNGPNRLRIVTHVKREIRKNKRVSFYKKRQPVFQASEIEIK